jgi:predicted GNAT family N-acyltransferase
MRENINFEIIRDLKIETKEIGEDLSEEEKAQIKKIAIENYSEIYKNAPEELKSVLEELDAELNLEKITGQRKYILKYKEQLIAFCRFKPIEGSSTDVYGGSFHVYRDLQNLCIGKYFVEKAIDKESEKYNIRAICRTELFEQLYQKMGFEKQDEIEENGVKYYNIILPKKETSQEK